MLEKMRRIANYFGTKKNRVWHHPRGICIFFLCFFAKSGICLQDEKKKMTRSGSPMTGSSASESVVVSTLL